MPISLIAEWLTFTGIKQFKNAGYNREQIIYKNQVLIRGRNFLMNGCLLDKDRNAKWNVPSQEWYSSETSTILIR